MQVDGGLHEAEQVREAARTLVMPLSENFKTKTKPIPTECQFGKLNTKPISCGL